MKTLVVGLGTQGVKRIKFIKNELAGSVDPVNTSATYYEISEAPLDAYDAVFLCVPDKEKPKLIDYCIQNRKHVLVEKPLSFNENWDLIQLQSRAVKSKVFIYTAYNHRFEPHFKSVKKILGNNEIGKIYSIKMFYGNGTSQLVKSSDWRDKNMGVISDLAPHLLDTLAFWIGIGELKSTSLTTHNFETVAPDHAIIHFDLKNIFVQLEMTLCMWKNTFQCDIIGEKGSLHISSLCKWGPTILTKRDRVLPSGIPKENSKKLELLDPTWEEEHEYFYSQIRNGVQTDLTTDRWISESLSKLLVKA
jgi:scyllo-inositol 2-dehydrogenase (NADP+)